MADETPVTANGQDEQPRQVRIGVLALQGSFREHIASLRRLPHVEAVEVRTKEQLRSVDGLIIPGMSRMHRL
jgi:pyridoxal 5'-phosphate synthase pdxT subunit